MFYLDRRGDPIATAATKYDLPLSNGEENFGWWLSHCKLAVSPRSRCDRDHRSPGSSASMLFYVNSDDSDDWTFAQEASDGQQYKTREKIELRTFVQDDLNIEMIGSNAGKTDNWPTIYGSYNARNESKYKAVRLERLILREEYRIPSPSSRCSLQPRAAPEVEGCRARSSCSLIDSGRIGESRPTSSVVTNSRGAGDSFAAETRSSEDHRVRRSKMISSLYSLKDTSGIQSSDYRSATQNDTPMCLCDELAIASKNRGTAINEVASILKSLPNDPEKATVLLEEEDRFCRSSHDQLTRLALAIEMDAEEAPANLNDPNNWERQLRDKIERLQHGHREIRGDIRGLRGDFQCDEKKISNVLGDTAKLRGEIRELRYLDDLLTLIQGELARISRRNWPFILGNNEPREEVNLIV